MEEKKKNSSKKTIYTILMMICIVVFLFSLYNVIKILNEYNEIDEYYEETQDQFAVVEEGILTFIDFAKIRGVNQDVIAWINIEEQVLKFSLILLLHIFLKKNEVFLKINLSVLFLHFLQQL